MVRQRGNTERLGRIATGFITLAFGGVLIALLWAKWTNFDAYLFDFARGNRVYERLFRGVPYAYTTHYYLYFYMPVYTLLLPVYALFRSVAVTFAIHILPFVFAVPVLYGIARRVLPGVLLPLAVVVAYVLNPTIDIMAASFLRLEAPWMLLFFLTVYFENRSAYRAAIVSAILACCIRIDAAPAIFLLGLLYVLQKKKRFGASVMAVSALCIGLMLAGMIGFHALTQIPLDLQQLHMENILSAGKGSFWETIFRTVKTVLNPASYGHFTVLLQFLLLPLLAPSYLLPALCSAAYIVITSESFLSIQLVSSLLKPDTLMVPFLHVHDSYLFPILFVAMIHGIRRLYRGAVHVFSMNAGVAAGFRGCLAVALSITFFLVHWFHTPPSLGPIPLTPAFNRDYYRSTPHSRLAWEILSGIPEGDSGWMQVSFASRAPKHTGLSEIYVWSEIVPETRYALFDFYAYSPNVTKERLLEKAKHVLMRDDFSVERFEDGILLLVRGKADEDNLQVLAFLEAHQVDLRRNLAGPYRHGPLSRAEARKQTFSETLLPQSSM